MNPLPRALPLLTLLLAAVPAGAQLKPIPAGVLATPAIVVPQVTLSAQNFGALYDGAPSAGGWLNPASLLKSRIAEGKADARKAKTKSLKADPKPRTPRLPALERIVRSARQLFGDPAIISRRGVKTLGVPEDGELNDEVRRTPLENAAREKAVVELFVQAGADPGSIRLQDIGRGANNVILTKRGTGDRVIVVGAHYDKVDVGQGTIDNWTGAAMLTNLYQALHDVPTTHTIVFIAFGREEEGLVGSAKYVRALTRDQLGMIDAMVNLDTLGVDGTYSWKNNSDQGLLRLFAETARARQLDLAEIQLWGGDADSTSFRRAGVPAMTLFGASPEVIFDIIHSEKDNFAAFSLKHYKNSYLLGLAALRALDGSGRPAPASLAAAR